MTARPPLAAALAVLLLAAGCYRGEPPPPLGEAVAVTITRNQARLVRIQALLQDAVSATLRADLGWRVHPGGTATLALAIDDERIDVVASDERDIPRRWRVAWDGRWTLDSRRHGRVTGRFTARGFYDDRLDQAAAVRAAASSAAEDIASALRIRLAVEP